MAPQPQRSPQIAFQAIAKLRASLMLKSIFADSAKSTRANITRRTPQITELIDAVEKWILTEDRGEKKYD